MNLSYNRSSIEPMLTKDPQDKTCQQGFQIVEAIAADRAAEVCLAREHHAQAFIDSYNLQALFDWANQIANRSSENLDVCAKQAEAMSLAIARASQLARARARGPDWISCVERAKDLDAAAKSAHTIACKLDKTISKKDQELIADVGHTFADEIVQSWYGGEFNPYLLGFTQEEAKKLKNFLYVNELITRGNALLNHLASEVWKEIQ